MLGEGPDRGSGRPLLQHRADHFGDDVTGSVDDDRVSLAYVLAPQIVLVVQSRRGHHHATHMHRLQFHVGRDPTRAAGMHGDAFHQGGALLGRKFVGHGPARGSAGGAQVVALPVAVDLDNHAVNLVVDVVAVLLPLGAVAGHLLQGGRAFDIGVDRQAHRAEVLQVLRMAFSARRTGSAGIGLRAVAPEAQTPGCGHGGILLAQAPGGGVARIGKGSFVSLCQFLIQAKEDRHRQVDLTTHLQHTRVLAARQARRDRANCTQVGGDVLAHASVAAGGTAHEDAVPIEKRHRQSVDLELAHEVEVVAAGALQTAQPRSQLVGGKNVVERQHGRRVLDGRKQLGTLAAHALGWAGRRDQIRESLLECAQLEHQAVVLGVRDGRTIKHVVAVVVIRDLAAQIMDPRLRRHSLFLVEGFRLSRFGHHLRLAQLGLALVEHRLQFLLDRGAIDGTGCRQLLRYEAARGVEHAALAKG